MSRESLKISDNKLLRRVYLANLKPDHLPSLPRSSEDLKHIRFRLDVSLRARPEAPVKQYAFGFEIAVRYACVVTIVARLNGVLNVEASGTLERLQTYRRHDGEAAVKVVRTMMKRRADKVAGNEDPLGI
jgi:hypothetical protein